MNYYICYPINGGAGTRNPCHGYEMISSKDLSFMKEVLKKRKKEDGEKYKKAFITTASQLKKLIN
tara:strand:- start:606 stop:800 length:195 start_codon:yes stop_codon:yes gene_type:complete